MSTPDHYRGLRIHRDLSPARWLDRPAETFDTVAAVCAPGFPAYARIFHPARLDDAPVRWSLIAEANGRLVHPGMQWPHLTGADEQPGLWDCPPQQGPTPPDVARLLAGVLTRHTRTPDRCWFGLWHGYGGLPRALSSSPTFSTPGRDEILLSGRLADITTPGDDELPDLWWPDDRAWCVGSDTDLHSTYVGGSTRCIAELLATPGLETAPTSETASAAFAADLLNGPRETPSD